MAEDVGAALLREGQLLTVADAAREVMGRPVDTRTAIRWGGVGRAGIPLPYVRGTKRRRLTTAAALRWWLLATSEQAQRAPAPQAQPDRAADAVLAGFGLARKEGDR